MFSHFMTKNKLFYDLFNQFAHEILLTAQLLHRVFQGDVDVKDISALRRERKNKANEFRRELFTLAHKTFITPFDRNDIHNLNKELYRGCSTALSVLARFSVYELTIVPPCMLQMAVICESAANSVVALIQNIENLSNTAEVLKICLDIKRFESEADALQLSGIATLFQAEDDTKILLKSREIYEGLEKITDYYLQIAFVIEGIVLEYT